MQLSNLNKTINLFLVGTVAICNILLLMKFVIAPKKIDELVDWVDKSNLHEGFIIALISGPILFIGIVLDTLTELLRRLAKMLGIIRLLLEKMVKHRIFEREISIYKKWERLTIKLISPRYLENLATKEGVAITVFFESASSASKSWVISHFASYMIAANFLVISLINFVVLLYYAEFFWAGLFLIVSLLLLAQVIEKFYYSYGFLFRYTALKLAGYLHSHAVSGEPGEGTEERLDTSE